MSPYFASQNMPLGGTIEILGDKSISHRAVILASLATGRSTISHLLESEDVLATIQAMRQLGAKIEKTGEDWLIDGVGVLGLQTPDDVLDMGNSGTSARLITGAAASHPMRVIITGDESLRHRPMARITDPLALGGVKSSLRNGKFLPLTFTGSDYALPIEYDSPVASAQIKSALLLYGLNVNGTTRITEPTQSRNHSELMLKTFGAHIKSRTLDDGRQCVSIDGIQALQATEIDVPGDISSAAFVMAAALIVPGSDVTLRRVGLNPTRTGIIDALERMSADIKIENQTASGHEPVGDIRVRASALQAIELEANIAPRMIDEYPVLAVAAAFAQGTTVMRGLGELRVKESDRIAAICRGLELCGVSCDSGEDWLAVTGSAPEGRVRGLADVGTPVPTRHDHRIAMSFLTMGLCSQNPVTVSETESIATSFPNFFAAMHSAGAGLIETQR